MKAEKLTLKTDKQETYFSPFSFEQPKRKTVTESLFAEDEWNAPK